jgi:hypothetical protein
MKLSDEQARRISAYATASLRLRGLEGEKTERKCAALGISETFFRQTVLGNYGTPTARIEDLISLRSHIRVGIDELLGLGPLPPKANADRYMELFGESLEQ